jgi:hypothetical protein
MKPSQRRITRLLAALAVVLVALSSAPRLSAASYPPNLNWDHFARGCMVESGNFCETMIEFLEENGGLSVFGLPVGQLYAVEGYLAMPFERFRVEYHPNNNPPYDMQLGIMGEERLIQMGYIWQNQPKEQPQAGCRYYPETGYNLCGEFLRYWDTHGREFGHPGVSYEEALALYGYPITPARMEKGSDGVERITQWFQRARFELHDGIGVLQGLLSAEVRAGNGEDVTVPWIGQSFAPVPIEPQQPAPPPQPAPEQRQPVAPQREFPSGRMTCSQFSSWAEAQRALAEGHTELDRDGDGEACESLR